mgnify:CR=1
MKTLMLLRHGKSSWNDPFLDDFDRPLKKRGRKAAARMGIEIRDRGILPDLVLSSAARRAWETWKRFQKASGYEGAIEKKKKLYFTSPEDHVELLSRIEDSRERVLLIGHNPDLEEVLERLTGQSSALPTASLAVIDLEIPSWADIEHATGALRLLLRPKDLADAPSEG